MSAKPTYKELVKWIQNLEHEAVKHKQVNNNKFQRVSPNARR